MIKIKRLRVKHIMLFCCFKFFYYYYFLLKFIIMLRLQIIGLGQFESIISVSTRIREPIDKK